ncbi:ILEI/PANDER domain-containing protein [Caenorhabditis elegans]|uniref:ILEI/PANDER domain-containing protein n=2 Tax=Caenorhabditis elegans TaxID=6239 RepID=Q688B0_CAEEL|nr:ILEI/PANDER domain-containing protein [Caenorhabditis elegans]CCD66977.1 ILEI/PANDER domain-containing protein [Caenorhabditis elegans]|eukprot:NP_500183.2 Uncharacterized protein CELE_M70.4 [Caenorhabditis elegans]
MIKVNWRLLLLLPLLLTTFLIFKFATLDGDNNPEIANIGGEKSIIGGIGKPKSLVDQVQEEGGASSESKCYYDNQCTLPQMLFRVRSETDSQPPFACLNDIKLFDTDNIGRGINAAILNGTTGDIIEKATFDVTASDEKLMTWLLKVPHASLLVAASFGDVAEHVSRQSRQLFAAFGAQKIDNWRVGNAYAIIGQRGIRRGEAHETVAKFLEENTQQKLFEGCFDLPIAEIGGEVELKIDGPPVHRADESKLAELGAFEADLLQQNKDVEYGGKWKNCGMDRPCNEADTIPVHFFSGEHKDDHPKMCIGGRMLFDKDLNSAGRGLNLAMLEPKTGKVTAVAHFDTYEDESHGLEEWLDAVPTGYIVAVVSFDEASNQLSDMARRIFYEMGSSMIDRLKFRASWYFVGQKGIGAYTPFEDLNIPQGNNWANPIHTSFCLPKSLHKWAGRRDTSSSMTSSASNDVRNLPKRHFCAKYDRHEEFCGAANLDSPIMPRHLSDEQRSSDAIFNVPILVASGLAPDSLRITLESLLNQEGLNTQMVLVTYDKEYSENADLVSLFHVKSVAIQSNGSYNAHLLLSLSNAFSIFPDASSVLVIEEDVTLSTDWLHYFSSIYEPYKADSTVDLALAFNSNGFIDTSGDGQTVYRIKNHLPIGSYLMKRDLYEKHIRLREFCCTERGNWDLRESISLVPAMSRIEIQVDELEKKNVLFRRNRTATQQNYLINTEFETSEEYLTHLNQLVQNTKKSIPITEIQSIGCEAWADQLDRQLKSILLTYSAKSEVESIFECWKMYWTPKILRSNRVFRFSLHQAIEVIIVADNLKIK